MLKYEDIQRVNESLATMDIKGKAYIPVNERIKGFRMLYPTGFIVTDILSNENGVCIIRATVGYYDDEGQAFTLGVGTAYEKEGSTFINKTSYIENAESSAVGRAIAMACAIGIDTSIASAEEVQNAMINQQAEEKISKVKIEALAQRCAKEGVAIETILNLYKVKSFGELTERMYSNINVHWDKIKAKENATVQYEHG